MSKQAIIGLIGSLGNRAGVIDSIAETSATVSDCQNNSWDITTSGLSTSVNFLSSLGSSKAGSFGGAFAILSTAFNTARTGKVSLNDLATVLAGTAGILARTIPAFTPIGALLNVGGLLITLYDLKNNSGNSSNQCSKRKSSSSLGDIVPPNCTPDTSPAQDIPLSCPLVIDMDGNGIKTISLNKNVFFDLDNNLFAENTGWIDKGDAFLVWDRDNNGIIDSGNELFGNHTLLANGQKAANGFTALAELDANKDGLFDSNDEAWAKLQLWFDRNQNGISEEGELMKLSESGIKGIDLTYQNSKQTDENGNEHREHSSVTWNDGRTTDITDVWFKTDNARSYYKEQVEIPDEIKAMPNIIAFGNLLDLHTAMVKNPTLS
ncbi:hypothetical protein RYD26_10210 [Pasteurellaceae bacterium LIM206]|nr:hypothetical protein [Pasteurellaceae bacterium LIM206]